MKSTKNIEFKGIKYKELNAINPLSSQRAGATCTKKWKCIFGYPLLQSAQRINENDSRSILYS